MRKNVILTLFVLSIPLASNVRILLTGGVPIYLTDIFLALALARFVFVAHIGDLLRSGKFVLLPSVILLSGVVGLIYSLVSGNPSAEVLYGFTRMVLSVSPFFWAYDLALKGEHVVIMKMLKYLVLSSSIMCILGFGVLFDWGPIIGITEMMGDYSPALKVLMTLHAQHYYRLTWNIGNATVAGGLLAIAGIVGMILLGQERFSRKDRLIMQTSLVINVTGLLATWTRHAMAGFCVGALLSLFLERGFRKKMPKSTHQGTLIVLLVTICAMVFVGQYITQQIGLFSGYHQAEFTERMDLADGSTGSDIYGRLSALFEAKEENLVAISFGGGPGYVLVSQRLNEVLAGGGAWGHNFMSTFIVNWGLVGVCCFIVLFCSLLRQIIHMANQGKIGPGNGKTVMFVCVVSYVVMLSSFPLDHYYASLPIMSSLMWMLLGVGAGLIAENKADNAKREKGSESFRYKERT